MTPHARHFVSSLPPEGARFALGRPGGGPDPHARHFVSSLPPEGARFALGRPGGGPDPHARHFVSLLPPEGARFALGRPGGETMSSSAQGQGASEFASVDWRGRAVSIEYQRIAPERTDAPLLVFLHEGLGSVAMWKDFPRELCERGGFRGIVFSRTGYGRSTPRADDEIWDVDFMHRQAHEVLPAFFEAIGLATERPWLFGHSDGGSISLLYATRFPDRVAGLVVLAPHLFVEDVTTLNIEKARTAYLETDLAQRLGRYHDSADSAFWGWNRIWLHPPFGQWNIEAELDGITCPILAMQGIDDEYGTLQQIRRIAERLPQTQLVEVPDCGHSPHRDQPEAVIVAAVSFVTAHSGETRSRVE